MPFSTVTSAACVFHVKKAPLCGFLMPEWVSQRSTDLPCWAFPIKASLCVLVTIIIERSQNLYHWRAILLNKGWKLHCSITENKEPPEFLRFFINVSSTRYEGCWSVITLCIWDSSQNNNEDRCEEPQLMIISSIKVAPLLQAWFLVRRASPTGDQGLCRPPGCSPSPAGNGHSGQIVHTLASHLV